MNEEFNETLASGAKGAAEGFAKGIAEKIPPVYNDLLQPGAQALGKGIGGAIRIALLPISGTIWGIDKISEWLEPKLARKLGNVDINDIVTPKGSIVGPAIEAVKFLSSEDELREMFAQLIATSLNKNQADLAHPGFVEIIKNLSTADALVLKYITDRVIVPTIDFWISEKDTNAHELSQSASLILRDLDLASRWNGAEIFKNLERLGLIERKLGDVAENMIFIELLKSKEYLDRQSQFTLMQTQGIFDYFEQKMIYTLTSFGQNFTSAVFETHSVNN